MERSLLEQMKPAARRRTHLLLAAGMWTLVGTGLLAAGVVWCVGVGLPWSVVVLGLGVGLGLAKARWVLIAVAQRNADRIVERGDGHCLGGFVSWRGWLMIGGMMGLGWLLRGSPLPRGVLGVVYVAVGSALVMGSVRLWRVRVGMDEGGGGRARPEVAEE